MINQPHSSSLTIRRIIAARSASRSLPIHVSYPHDFARKGRVKSNDNVTEPAIFTVVPAFENVTQPSGLVANCIGVATPSSGLGTGQSHINRFVGSVENCQSVFAIEVGAAVLSRRMDSPPVGMKI